MTWLDDVVEHYRPREGQAQLYGVVLYTDAHPHIKKVINDEDYWRSLDERSGPRWVIFSVRAEPGVFTYPSMGRDTMALMVPIWREPAANKQLLEQLEIDSTKDFPALAILAKDDKGEVLSTLVPLDDNSVASAYQSLKSAVESVTTALDQILDENRRRGAQAFFVVTYALRELKIRRAMKGLVGVYQYLLTLIP